MATFSLTRGRASTRSRALQGVNPSGRDVPLGNEARADVPGNDPDRNNGTALEDRSDGVQDALLDPPESDFLEAPGRVLVQQAGNQRLVRQASASARFWMAFKSLLESRIFKRRSLRNVAFAYREYRARSRLPPLADFHSPRSTDSTNSFSSASIFIVGLLTQVLLRRLTAREIVFINTVCSSSTNGTKYT